MFNVQIKTKEDRISRIRFDRVKLNEQNNE